MSDIILKNISHNYGETKVLHSVNITIQKGEFFTLLGPSGCGKTTLLRILAGFIQSTSGQVLIDDTDITALPPEKRNMGIVFQNYALFPNMTVQENIAYGLKIRKFSKAQIKERCDKYMELSNLQELANRKINELSGGQQQRVAIARALAIEPQMLLLDEPMSNLDVALRVKMREEIRTIQKQTGITTLFITHDQQEALSVSDKIAVMRDGEVLQLGTPWEIYDNPNQAFVANFVGTSNCISSKDFSAFGISLSPDTPHIFVRPERMQLTPSSDKVNTVNPVGNINNIDTVGKIDKADTVDKIKKNSISVQIKEIKFVGLYYEYTVASENQIYRIIEINEGSNSNKWKIGDTARLSIRQEHIIS